MIGRGDFEGRRLHTSACGIPSARPHEADDILHVGHRLAGHAASPVGAFGEDPVDMAGISEQALHLAADRPQLGHREIDQRAP